MSAMLSYTMPMTTPTTELPIVVRQSSSRRGSAMWSLRRCFGLLALLLLASVARAEDLFIGQAVAAELPNDGTKQSYTVTIGTQATYVVAVAGYSTDFIRWTLRDSILTLYADSGEQIGFDDDGGPGLDSRLTINLAPGTYTFEVGSYNLGNGGTYSLLLLEESDFQARVPVITIEPQDVWVNVDDDAIFSVEVQDPSRVVSYQWLMNGSPVAWSVGNELSFNWFNTNNDGNHIQVVITNDAGSVESSTAILHVQHQSSSLAVGQAKLGRINNSSQRDVYPFYVPESGEYRVTVEGAPVYTLIYPSLFLEDHWGGTVTEASGYNRAESIVYLYAGQNYSLFVNHGYWPYLGSYAVTLARNDTPYIKQQPQPVTTLSEGQNTTFSVIAGGNGPLQYQWTRNGESIPGATDSSITVQAVGVYDGSTYKVIVSNNVGTVTSNGALLYVRAVQALAIGSASDGVIRYTGEVNSYRLDIAHHGGYQFDAIAANRDSTRTLSGAHIEIMDVRGAVILSADDYYTYGFAKLFVTLDPGTYFINVKVSSNYYWPQQTGTYRITAQELALPTITTQPISITRNEGQAAVFQVTATNAAPVTYQWLRNGVDISYANDQSYQVTATQALDGSIFQARVSTVAGSVLSDPVTLSVTTAPTLAIGQSIEASIDSAGDVDWYHITITEAGGYQALVSGRDDTHTLIYSHIQIWDSNGARINESVTYVGSASAFASLVPGSYTIVVSSYYGYTGTYAVSLLPVTPPVITNQPTSISTIEGHPAIFSVTAASSAPMTYRWLKGGVQIYYYYYYSSNAYNVPTTDLSQDGSVYQVEVSNVAGSVMSDSATLGITRAPTLAIGQTIEASITQVNTSDWYHFTITEAGGYQVKVSGSGGHTLYYPIASIRDSAGTSGVANSYSYSDYPDSLVVATLPPGSYIAVVNHYYSSSTGTYAISLQKVLPPTIITQPQSKFITEGQSAVFQVSATSNAPLTYQWYQGNSALNYQTADRYTVYNSTTSLNGNTYKVAVSNVAGTVISDVAELSVSVAPNLAVSQTIAASIDPVGDVDWYRIAIPSVGGYRIDVAGLGTDSTRYTLVDPLLRLMNNASYEIAQDDDSGPGNDASLSVRLDPGNYLVAVQSYRLAKGTYAVSLTQLQPPTIVTQPANVAIIVGQSATFGVDVAGEGNIRFQWRRDGTDTGSRSRTYTVTANDTSLDGSQYQVIVSNEAGSVTSTPATLTVNTGIPQVISGFELFGTHTFGDPTITLAGVMGGASGNPVVFASTNSSIASVAGSVVTIQHAGTVIITANQAGTAEYTPAAPVSQTLVVDKAPQVITFADLGTVPFGTALVTLSASASSGLPVAFTVLGGLASINGTALNFIEAGDIVVVAGQSGDGDRLAAPVVQKTLSVTASAPLIAVQPISGEVAVGGSLTLTVTVSNPFSVEYQWFAGDTAISGATQSSYLATAVDSATVDYHVVVTNRYGSTASDVAHVSGIQVPVRIVTHPHGASVLAGSSVSFSVGVEGSQPLSYQWLRNGAPMSGATGSSLLLVAKLADDGAVFQVDVTNPLGTARSAEALVRVYGPPQIIVPPTDITQYDQSPVTFTVIAESLGPVTYQWYRDQQVVIGATSPNYSLTAISTTDDGAAFTVVLTNSAGSTTTSPAVLHVLPRLAQSITGFGTLAPHTLGSADRVLRGVIGGGSGNPIVFSSSDQAVATVLGSTIHAVGVGTTHITASQAGNTLYAPATPVMQDLAVVIGAQTIAFAAVRPQPFGTPPFALSATASSGLPVTLTVVDGPATIDNHQVSLTGIGTVTITASQAGNANYLRATDVTRTIEVTATAPIIVQQPNGVTAPVGAACSLTVTVANHRYATYQWFRNGSAISGATQATCIVTAPGLDSVDTYHVEVANLVGTTVSADASVRGILLFPSITRQPQPTAVYRGGTAVFNIEAQGSAPLVIQWFRNGSPVPGANAATWSFTGVTDADDRAQMYVTVSNAAGTTTSESVTLRVHAAPRITVQPADVSVDLGMQAEFKVTVESTLPVSYQWTRGGFPIAGAMGSSYSFPSTTIGDDGTVLRLVATNELGAVTSSPAILHVSIVPPFITQQPTSVVLTDAGSQVDFAVVVRSGLPVTYQWYRDGNVVPGITATHYAFVPTDSDLGAVFFVIITNDMGSVTSANATITRVAKPVITKQPIAKTVDLGQRAYFFVEARSFDPARTLQYQWRRNGVDISGATSSSLTMSSTVLADDGAVFTVLVSDGPATQISQGALLQVTTTPVALNGQSGDVGVDPGTQASFAILATGTAPISYQWYRDGQAIPGATQNRYTTAPVTDADYGSVFRAEVSNLLGSALSNDMRIVGNPVITGSFMNPQSIGLTIGQTASLRVTVRGQRPIGFRWYRDDVLIPDAISDTYLLPPVSSADNGARYSVTAWNVAGEAATGWPLVVYDDAPPVIASQPQDQSVPLGQNATFVVSVISPSDAPTYQWYRDGTAIVGETQASFVLERIVASDIAAHFHVVVTNRFGSVTSRDAQVSAQAALAIVTQPRSVTVNAGDAAMFNVVANMSASYRWLRNGALFQNNINAQTLTLLNASIADSGAIYQVVVQGPFGQTVTSDAVTLTVIDNPPVITVQPVGVQATVGQNAIFSVTVTGSQPMHYTWSRDGVLIDNQDASTLSVPVWSLADDGAKFHVEVSNLRGRVTSSTVTLTARFIPATVMTDPDIVAEIHADSVIIHPTAVVSNGDRTGIVYSWGQLSGSPLNLHVTPGSAHLLITDLLPGSYAVNCKADYSKIFEYGYLRPIATTQHVFKFNVTRPLNWITAPRMVGPVSQGLAVRLAAVAGFGSTEDPVTSYHWSQVSGPSGATFVANDGPAAKASQIQLPDRGRYTIDCTADWRGTKITRQVVIDTDAKTEDPSLLGAVSSRTLLVAASAFDATRWQADATYRTAYLAGVEPGRVWQSSPPGDGLLALRSSDPLHRHATAGTTITVHVHVPVGSPVSWATLHGGSFVSNSLNSLTVAANDAGDAAVDVHVPNHSGTYLILAASPLAVGRLSFTVVVP